MDRIRVNGHSYTVDELREIDRDNHENSVFIGYMECFYKHIEKQQFLIEKYQQEIDIKDQEIEKLRSWLSGVESSSETEPQEK